MLIISQRTGFNDEEIEDCRGGSAARILLVSPGLPPDKTGGIENYVRMVREGLVRRGHSVTILTELHRTLLDDSSVKQIGLPEGEFRGYAYWATRAWFRALRARYEIMHFNGFPGQILSLAPLPSPKVVHVHNSLSMEAEWRDGGLRHDIGYLVASQAFRRASVIICPTEVVRRDLSRHLEGLDMGKIRVIPNCVDTQFYNREHVASDVRDTLKIQDKFVIIYFGKIKRTKGIETLCKAFQLLKKQVDAALIIGGTFPATDLFARYLKATYTDVVFTGFVQDPRPYYAAANVFSINTSGFDGGETFAISLAEAMSMGLPVVCADNPIFAEVTRGNALFAKPGDPESLAEKLVQLADNHAEGLAMGRRSRAIAERFYDVTTVVEQLENAYSDVSTR